MLCSSSHLFYLLRSVSPYLFSSVTIKFFVHPRWKSSIITPLYTRYLVIDLISMLLLTLAPGHTKGKRGTRLPTPALYNGTWVAGHVWMTDRKCVSLVWNLYRTQICEWQLPVKGVHFFWLLLVTDIWKLQIYKTVHVFELVNFIFEKYTDLDYNGVQNITNVLLIIHDFK